jgi:hypothetical protein
VKIGGLDSAASANWIWKPVESVCLAKFVWAIPLEKAFVVTKSARLLRRLIAADQDQYG